MLTVFTCCLAKREEHVLEAFKEKVLRILVPKRDEII
jgi:hypothetical protein